MDTPLFVPDGNGLLREWVDALRAAAESIGLRRDVMPIRGWLGGAMLVACVRRLGGTVEPLEPFYGWTLQGKDTEDDLVELREWAPELDGGGIGLRDFHGVVAICLPDETFVALRTDEPVTHHHSERVLVLAGPSREATLSLAARTPRQPAHRRLRHAPQAHRRHPRGRAGPHPARGLQARAAGVLRRIRARRPRVRADAPLALARRAPHRRPRHRQDADGAAPLRTPRRRAVVAIEDIDRLFESGYLTPQFFLNALDGLFRPRQPVLWVATSNDPRGLEQNVLDRPGRFDQVFVFPLPGVVERAALIERYAAWPVDTSIVEEIARGTDGLSAAHIREVCYAAALASADAPAGFADALRHQVGRVIHQHQRARSYDFGLGVRKAGFA